MQLYFRRFLIKLLKPILKAKLKAKKKMLALERGSGCSGGGCD